MIAIDYSKELTLWHCRYNLGAADFDSSLFSRNARVIRAGRTNSIFISISVDNVAQEGAESGTLRLVFAPGSSQPAGTFFKRDLAVTVNDTTSE